MAGPFILGIVATPFLFAAWLVNRIFEHRVRVQQIRQLHASPRTMPALPASAEVERRLANLEAIVCDLDFDLAQRVREAARTRAA
jgi:hypothetical protein